MDTQFNTRLFSKLTLLVMGAVAMATPAIAQNQPSAADSRYQMERANCFNGKSNEDGATCLKEANAALAAAKRGKLSDVGPQYQKNATLRCQALPSTDREACEKRMGGEGTVSGSVEGGGILRELVVQTPPKPAPAIGSSDSVK